MSTTSTPTTTSLGTVESLHAEAADRTGLSDFGGEDHLAPMEVLLASYRDEAGLTPAGVHRIATMLRTVLEVRLRLVQSRAENPAAQDARIRRPLFVTGLPRTGTTALHRLLCLDPGSQGLEHWLTEAPKPRPARATWADDPDHRRMEQLMEAHHRANPDMHGMHFMSPDMVEECWRAERLSMRSIAFQNTAHLPGYSRWLAGQDMGPAYRAHREMLSLVGIDDPERRWVLKSPSHLFGLDALMATYPDALVIQTHRDPRTIVASVSSLNSYASAGTSTTFTPEVVGRDCLDMWSRGARAFAEARARHDPAQFIDVQYDDFVADAPGVVEQVHQHFGLPLSDDVRRAVSTSHEESKRGERRPTHHYSLEEFGLTVADVEEAFDLEPGR